MIMPGASEEIIDAIEKRLGELPRVSTLIDEGQSSEEILATLLPDTTIEVLEKMPVQFHCDCTKEKFATAIITLGADEIQAMIDEDHGAEAVCSFCGNKYHFDETELAALKKEAEA